MPKNDQLRHIIILYCLCPKGIKAFCKNKDDILFLIEVEAPDQPALDSNLATGVEIINTAKHK